MVIKMQLVIKRVFDLLFSTVSILILFPILVIIGLLIAVILGWPVLFLQKRIGLRGREFNIIKFRTMTTLKDNKGKLLSNEDRLTKFGNFLRKTTLDELPELVNVFLGDMSIVGPRPLLVEYRDLYSEEQWRRHDMPPGMAGPVLAKGRNSLTWDEKFNQDTWYVDNWSLWLDLKILVQTILKVIRREGISATGYATMPKFTGIKKAGIVDKE